MLTKAEITAAANTFDETDKTMITTLVRNSVRYKSNPALFSDFGAKLIEANATIKAQQVNAMMLKIQELGVGEAAIRGGEDALYYSQTTEREQMINYIISVLYAVSEGVFSFEDTTITVRTLNGYGVGQREVEGDFI